MIVLMTGIRLEESSRYAVSSRGKCRRQVSMRRFQLLNALRLGKKDISGSFGVLEDSGNDWVYIEW